MKARLFTSLSNGLSGVKSRGFLTPKSRLPDEMQPAFPPKGYSIRSKCLLHRRKRPSLFSLFPKKLLFTSWFISIEQQPGNTKKSSNKEIKKLFICTYPAYPLKEKADQSNQRQHIASLMQIPDVFFTPTGERPEINDSGRVRKAKSQNDKKRLSQGSLIYIVPKNTTFA